MSRIERSSSEPVTRPTGAARFCSCSAWTTCPTLTPAAWSLDGTISTVSSRSTFPKVCTSATPAIERSSRVMPGSTSRVSSADDNTVDDTATDTIGRSVSLNLRTIGSLISTGRSARMPEMASRTSWDASLRSFSYRNSIISIAYPSYALLMMRFTPAIDPICSSMGSSTSFSTTSGDAPG
jgi:hypothetical protein